MKTIEQRATLDDFTLSDNYDFSDGRGEIVGIERIE